MKHLKQIISQVFFGLLSAGAMWCSFHSSTDSAGGYGALSALAGVGLLFVTFWGD